MARGKTALLVVLLFTALSVVAAPLVAGDATYNYIAPEDLKARILSNESMTLLDIQAQEEFSMHHIRGAVATYAYPVKSDEEKGRIEAAYAKLADGSDPVVIVCPRGGGGARRTCDYLINRGIDARRLLILEKGQEGWPYGELLEGNKK